MSIVNTTKQTLAAVRKCQEDSLPVPGSSAKKLPQYRQGDCRRHYPEIQIHIQLKR